ncbi:McrB family protein [Acinetobacter sp. Marseille-Q1623]|uniref:McrB family protein n=1 Tax=Acinetobacter sp. Marseille-Q1623 TaxID=2697501 RepID=UPI001C2DC79D|nr:AAA family ATPase [Acinetobacter sp. Marseille-Q1623]
MTVVTNESDREIALVLTGAKVSIFIEKDPEDNGQFSFNFKSTKDVPNGKYSEQDGRHSGLKSQSQHLWLGNQVYYIELDTVEELEKFCDWYEQNDNQTTVLERKVKAFLELWSVERLKNLTIEDYHQAKNTDCFISQVDSFDPTQGDPTFACYFDFWEPIGLGNNEKYHNEKPYSWHKRLGDDPELAFQQIKQEILDIIAAVQRRDLIAIDQIQFTKGLKWMIAFLYQNFSNPCVIPIVTETNIKRIGYESYLKTPLPEFLPILIKNQGNQSFFPYVEKLFTMVRKGYLANKQKKQKNEEIKGEVMMEQALNRILFGAAGTGKTYHTINHAVSILDPEYDPQLDRKELKKRFDIYKKQGQIQFVTFHQSFSYEDFVEGIRAETDKQGQLRYDVKAGVFKKICDQAKQIDNNQSITQVTQPIEFGKGYILKKMNTELLEIQKPNGNVIHLSRVLTDFLLREFRNGKITDRNLAEKKVIEILGESEILEPYLVNGYSAIWANLIPFLDKLLHSANPVVKEKSKYVIIIDEINRGNISRIFGELITLIEDSKRQGADEALSVTLPYSKEEFSVPNNVYIIGTMNSSDRSLTGLDIALRRRFTFIEMPPQPQEIKNEDGELIKISGKDKDGNDKDVIVADILSAMNQRIEVLLDRDHCIGHANFMSLKEKPTLEHLAHIFKQKIIPQLQEYFFDDWAKINLVFFNNSMIVEDKDINIAELFPSKFEQELGYSSEKKIWKINNNAFKTIDAFIQILGSKE